MSSQLTRQFSTLHPHRNLDYIIHGNIFSTSQDSSLFILKQTYRILRPLLLNEILALIDL